MDTHCIVDGAVTPASLLFDDGFPSAIVFSVGGNEVPSSRQALLETLAPAQQLEGRLFSLIIDGSPVMFQAVVVGDFLLESYTRVSAEKETAINMGLIDEFIARVLAESADEE